MGLFSSPGSRQSGGLFGGYDTWSRPKKQKRQKKIKPEPAPGVFDRALSGLGSVLEIIDRPKRVIQEGIGEAAGVGTPDVDALDILLHGKTGHTGRSLVDTAFGATDKSTPWYDPGNLARAAGGFALDVALDPTTYLSFGTEAALKDAGKSAVKEGVEQLGERMARSAVEKAIEGGARNLGEKAGIRFMGKTIIPKSTLAAAGEATGISKVGRRIAQSPISQALGERFVPGFVPAEVKAMGPNAVAAHKDLYNLLKSQNRLADLRMVERAKGIAARTQGFTDTENRLMAKLVENPQLGYGARKSGELTDEMVDVLRLGKAESDAVARNEMKLGVLGNKRENYLKHQLKDTGRRRSMASKLAREYEGDIGSINKAAGDNFFEDLYSVLHGTRMAESSKKLTQVETVEKVLKRFGKKLEPGEVLPPGFGVYRREGTKLIKVPSSMVLESHGFGTPKAIKAVESLTDPAKNKALQGYHMLPNAFGDLVNKEMSKTTRDALSTGRDKLLNLWKGYVYGVRPGAQGRNATWNTLMQVMGGIKNPIGRAKQAAEMIEGVPGTLKNKLGESIDYATFLSKMKEHGVIGHGYYGADEVQKIGDILRPVKGNLNPFSPNNAAIKAGRRFGTAVENNGRLALAIDRWIKGDTFEEIARQVNKYLFDYSELTKFERDTMKRLVPFYTFTRKNIPLQMKLAIEKPGAMLAVGKAKNAIESLSPKPDEKYLPDYLKRGDTVRTPFTKGGKPLYWKSNLGFEDIKKPLQPNELFSALSPEIKSVVELLTNRNVYYDAPIEKYPGQMVKAPDALAALPKELRDIIGIKPGKGDYYKGKQVMSPVTRYKIEQIPLSRDVLKMSAGNEQSPLAALAFLTGLRFTPYDAKLSRDIAEGTRPRKKKKKLTKVGPLGF